MPKLSFAVPHTLGQVQAKERIDAVMPQIQEQYKDMIKEMEQSWNDNTLSFGFKTMGMRIGGALAVNEADVAVNIDLPLTAMMFKGRIEQDIRSNLEKRLR